MPAIKDPKETVVTPTEEEQEAVTGGATTGSGRGRPDLEINPGKTHRPIRAPWRPGPPPEGFGF
jgi:hypothetical protein